MNLTKSEIDQLKKSKNEKEWNAVCDQVKNSRQGRYPDDWFEKVVLSGLISEITAHFE